MRSFIFDRHAPGNRCHPVMPAPGCQWPLIPPCHPLFSEVRNCLHARPRKCFLGTMRGLPCRMSNHPARPAAVIVDSQIVKTVKCVEPIGDCCGQRLPTAGTTAGAFAPPAASTPSLTAQDQVQEITGLGFHVKPKPGPFSTCHGRVHGSNLLSDSRTFRWGNSGPSRDRRGLKAITSPPTNPASIRSSVKPDQRAKFLASAS